MLSVAEAQHIVLQHARPLPAETTPLTPAALGLVLAEDIVSDLDMPPYDKALMDGYALRSADLPDGHGVLTVIEEITAGRTPQFVTGSGSIVTRSGNSCCSARLRVALSLVSATSWV